MTVVNQQTPSTTARSDRAARIALAAAALGTVVPFALCEVSGASGDAIVASLEARSTTIELGAGIAAVLAAALFWAAVRLGRAVGDTIGTMVTAAGSAVALMYAAYYAAFASGAVVISYVVDTPTAAVGEGTSLLLQLTELTRYAPGLALVVAAVAARRVLPRGVWMTALGLVVMTLVPFTSWVAALLIPLWLAASAATVRSAHPE